MFLTNRMSALLVLGFVIPLAAARCGDADRSALSDGDVVASDSTYQALDHQISSDDYRRTLAAQAALDSVGFPDVARVRLRNVTPADVDRVVKSLEDEPRTREAIESADISVRDYVLTSIALAQSWDALNRPSLRVTGIPETNSALVRAQAVADPVAHTRVRPRFIEEHDDDDDDDRGRKVEKRKHKKGDKGKRGRDRDD